MIQTLDYVHIFQIFYSGLAVLSTIIMVFLTISQKRKPVNWKTQTGYKRFRLIWTAIPLLIYSILIVFLAPYVFVPENASSGIVWVSFYLLAGLLFTLFVVPMMISLKKYGMKVVLSNRIEP